MQNSFYGRINHYVMETILLYILFILPSFGTNRLPSPKLFFCLLILGGLTLTFVISKLADGSSLYSFLLIIPVFAYIGMMLGSGFLLSFFLSSFAAWRIYIHMIKEPNISDEKLLIITFWLGSVVYIIAAIYHYPYRNVIFGLIVMQLLLLSLKKILNGIQSSHGVFKNSIQVKKYPIVVLFFVSLGVVAFLGTITASFLLKKIWAVLSIFISKLIIYITTPIFSLLEGITLKPKTRSKEGNTSNSENALDELRKQAMNEPYDSHLYTIIAIIAGIIMVLIIIYYFIKKKAQKKVSKEEYPSTVQFQSRKVIDNVFTKLKRKINSPDNKMRKLIFDLQIAANKANRGRLSYETIEEWLGREGFLNEQLVETYSKVRYGEAVLTDQEYEQCAGIVADLKEAIRSLQP